MAVFRCKMCGGSLEINGDLTATTCEYCGSQQTLPRLSDDKLERLYDRANHFRRNNEFDKAMGIYEQILDENSEDSEIYWSIVLCRYGIEYVEDSKTQRRIPTVNRAQLVPVSSDPDYALALKYADASQKTIYENEARAIDEILEGIFAFSRQEEAFDVFLSYKETDDTTGNRTQDSLDALEIFYLPLIKKGYNVFYAPMTLKEKHIPKGKYDSYIFSALSSAKVMIVLGSREEYFQAEWVKNEWGRYLNRIVKNNEDKDIIPVYRNMSPNQLPEKLRGFEAFDLSKPDTLFYVIQKIEHMIPKNAPQNGSMQAGSATVSDNQLYNVRLISWGRNKLLCIKVVRETFGLDLKEAKDLVEGHESLLARAVPLNRARHIERTFGDNGIDVRIEIASGGGAAVRRGTDEIGVGNLLKRVTIFLESEDWDNADAYCERVLDMDPENGPAYMGKLLAFLEIRREEDIPSCGMLLEDTMPYKNALRFADEETANRLIEYNRIIKQAEQEKRARQEQMRKEELARQEQMKKEELARKEQARQEELARMEKVRLENERRKELADLRVAKENTTRYVTARVSEKEKLKADIASKQVELKRLGSPFKLKFLSVLVLFTAVASFVALVRGAIDDSVGYLSLFALGGVLFMIFSAMLMKADGKSAALALLNLVTYGIFAIVIAIIALAKNTRKKQADLIRETNARAEELQRYEAELDTAIQSLKQINQKLESFEE